MRWPTIRLSFSLYFLPGEGRSASQFDLRGMHGAAHGLAESVGTIKALIGLPAGLAGVVMSRMISPASQYERYGEAGQPALSLSLQWGGRSAVTEPKRSPPSPRAQSPDGQRIAFNGDYTKPDGSSSQAAFNILCWAPFPSLGSLGPRRVVVLCPVPVTPPGDT